MAVLLEELLNRPFGLESVYREQTGRSSTLARRTVRPISGWRLADDIRSNAGVEIALWTNLTEYRTRTSTVNQTTTTTLESMIDLPQRHELDAYWSRYFEDVDHVVSSRRSVTVKLALRSCERTRMILQPYR
ncbi:MAG: hypothetical protein H0V17_08395 [Deltaproteobacteria bacterium]|nr:hypothetical protein [Deltaproteobacteria bacterium]